jgi:hypothetical protein
VVERLLVVHSGTVMDVTRLDGEAIEFGKEAKVFAAEAPINGESPALIEPRFWKRRLLWMALYKW